MDALPLQDAIELTVPGKPVAWARTRGGKIRFTPSLQRTAMADYKVMAKAAMRGRPPIEGPVSLEVVVVWPPSPSWSRKKRERTHWRTGRPDIDNLAKLVGDALNGITWIDDAQITHLTVFKVIGSSAEVRIKIKAL